MVHHLESSIPYMETILPLLRAGRLHEAADRIRVALREDHFGLMSLLAALGFEALGVSFLSARLMTAALGTLSILAAYSMGRALEDARTGLLFAFLLAISPWHVTLSRYPDLEHVLCPLQLMLALGLYAAAFRRGGAWRWTGAGLALGFSFYVYAPNQVLPFVVALHLGLMLCFRRGFGRREWWRVGLLVLGFAAVAGDALRTLVATGFAPGVQTGYLGEAPRLLDFARHGRMLAATARQLFMQVEDPWFMKPGGGLSLTEAALLLPGVLLCVRDLFGEARRWSAALLLVALSISLVPGVLAPDPSFRRFYPTATLALLFAARTLSRAADAAARRGVPRRTLAGAAAGGALALAAVNAHVFLDRSWIETENGSSFLTRMAMRVKESFGQEFVYVYAPPGVDLTDYHRFIRFATYHEQRELERRGGDPADFYRVMERGELLWVLPSPRRLHGRTRFVAEEALLADSQEGVNARAEICAAYPGAEEEAYRDARGEIVLRSWRISLPESSPAPDRSAPGR